MKFSFIYKFEIIICIVCRKVQIGCRKSLYSARFTPKVGVFDEQLLNYLKVNLPISHNKVLLRHELSVNFINI